MSGATDEVFPYPAGPGGTVPPQYAQLLDQEPVSRVQLADGTAIWLVTRDADVRTVLTDSVFSRAGAAALPGIGFGRSQGTGIVDLDPPRHTAFRTPVAAAFSAERAARWRPRVEEIAGHLAESLRDGPGPVDLVASYTAPFAGRVVCELLGFDGDRWPEITGDVQTLLLSGGADGPEQNASRTRLAAAFTGLLDERRGRDGDGDDVAGVLLGLDEPDAEGGKLTDQERVLLLHGLVISGFIGVRDLLARHLYAVLAAPGIRDRLVRRPELIPGAVAELLRFYPSSNDGLLRTATEDVELSGVRIPAGAAVLPLVSAACRDPRVLDLPDELDIERPETHTLAFGAGPHRCPATDLVLIQHAAGIGGLLAAHPRVGLAVEPGDVTHTSELLPLGVAALPVRLGTTL
ncbi:cytochrome P450 [Streptomyces fulvorobeus]|uniref:Cytochrome P450 n=1 Tax=Streptomyces fulvorobeus TaxID=284028 RepID=A0A7J0CDL4_9ACTN|nr:cytochrome P450 [Streptomyces fulvorobeus]NYE44104.1 cytochrome P450 [Streptomyces fulvorobeus]GFN00612.1 cytochrome P450 [Streptomyces fulvorobeus]